MDLGTFGLPWVRRQALLAVLGCSRLLSMRFHTRQAMPVLSEVLESAFGPLDDRPQEFLFDQIRAVDVSVDRASGGELALHAEF